VPLTRDAQIYNLWNYRLIDGEENWLPEVKWKGGVLLLIQDGFRFITRADLVMPLGSLGLAWCYQLLRVTMTTIR